MIRFSLLAIFLSALAIEAQSAVIYASPSCFSYFTYHQWNDYINAAVDYVRFPELRFVGRVVGNSDFGTGTLVQINGKTFVLTSIHTFKECDVEKDPYDQSRLILKSSSSHFELNDLCYSISSIRINPKNMDHVVYNNQIKPSIFIDYDPCLLELKANFDDKTIPHLSSSYPSSEVPFISKGFGYTARNYDEKDALESFTHPLAFTGIGNYNAKYNVFECEFSDTVFAKDALRFIDPKIYGASAIGDSGAPLFVKNLKTKKLDVAGVLYGGYNPEGTQRLNHDLSIYNGVFGRFDWLES